MIIDPRGLTVLEWTDYMTDELTGFSSPPRIDDPAHWREWALAVCQSPALASFNPPNPMQYADWLTWADHFNQAVELPT